MSEFADHEPRRPRCGEALHRGRQPGPVERPATARLVVTNELGELPAATRTRSLDRAGVTRKLGTLTGAPYVADGRRAFGSRSGGGRSGGGRSGGGRSGGGRSGQTRGGRDLGRRPIRDLPIGGGPARLRSSGPAT